MVINCLNRSKCVNRAKNASHTTKTNKNNRLRTMWHGYHVIIRYIVDFIIKIKCVRCVYKRIYFHTPRVCVWNIFLTFIPHTTHRNKEVKVKRMDSGKPNPKQRINCLGTDCIHAIYKMHKDCLTLWCNLLDDMVLNIQACPSGCWEKDTTGFPLPGFDVENIQSGIEGLVNEKKEKQ